MEKDQVEDLDEGQPEP